MPKFGWAEVCQCGCTATWDGWTQLPKRPSADIMPLVVAHRAHDEPWLAAYRGFDLREGEAQWLAEIEQLTRGLWTRNVPKATPVTGDLARDAEAERCFETTLAMEHALWFVVESDACFDAFPAEEHEHLRRIRELWSRFGC